MNYDHEDKELTILFYTISTRQRSTSKSGSRRETLEIHIPDFSYLEF